MPYTGTDTQAVTIAWCMALMFRNDLGSLTKYCEEFNVGYFFWG